MLGLYCGTKNAFIGSLLVSGYWYLQGISLVELMFLNTIPLWGGLLRQMKLNCEKESASCVEEAKGSYHHLKDRHESVVSEVALFEKRCSDLTRIYEITCQLGRALDLQELFSQLGEILYQTTQISSSWFVHIRPVE